MKRNEHNKSVGSKIERSDERINATSEVFTPMEVCIKIIQEIPEMMLKDSKSKFIDDSAGSGNFLLALQTELSKYHSLSHINDNMLYAIELMEDNHAEMCKRVGVPVDHPHFVCANALEYDCSFGEPVALENHLGKMEDKKPYVVQPVKHEPSQAVLPF
jgi:hypothetical protein|tara:strand:- start:202 stop:678 length:477 start_codon:yes stop_codon:yes gene_type:complete